MSDRRLIEDWLPIAELSEECTRERRSMTALPPTYYLHVWWARRPLVASRAAVLASLLPADADRKKFLHCVGIHGDPVKSRYRIEEARRTGVRFQGDAYDYPRAFKHTPDASDHGWLAELFGEWRSDITVLDPTAGGGSIPFETMRLGFGGLANDLNPVAALILKATAEWPARFGRSLVSEFSSLADRFVGKREERLAPLYPEERTEGAVPTNWIWARTVRCPYCAGQVPLSPNWRLAARGTGVRVCPQTAGGPKHEDRVCSFEIVGSEEEQSEGTVARGDGSCPFPDCGRVINGDEIKDQARDGKMGQQLFAVVFKEKQSYETGLGHTRWRWVRRFRAPHPEDDNDEEILSRLAEKLPEWDARGLVPSESYDDMYCDRSKNYGVRMWRDLFSPRQLLCHGTSVEVFHELLQVDRESGVLTDLRRVAYGYLALAIDKVVSYNSRMSLWDPMTCRIRNIFDRHDFSFKWSHGEMAPLVAGVGYDWAIRQTEKCIRELTGLLAPEGDSRAEGLFPSTESRTLPQPVITCGPGERLDDLDDSTIDAVVMDPPYYDNVMYAELSDFFYVWLKRTAGGVFPELFRQRLTDKENEAVANPARFAGEKGAKALAGREYQERMAAIFRECRRVLKPDGVMTLMFTHKATGAWDALATGLMDAGFSISASWPVATEMPGSLHIKDKAAANSTIFLVCRPRPQLADDEERPFWEDIEPQVAARVRERAGQFSGLGRVDRYLAAFGPALEEFSRHWPVRRGKPRTMPKELTGRARSLFAADWDPWKATPEDALLVARREVKRQVLERLTRSPGRSELDQLTDFFLLAWDAFGAPVFPYDEALKLARAAGLDLEKDIVGRLAEKKGQNLHLWDSVRRAGKNRIGPVDGSRAALDRLHHAANLARSHTLSAAKEHLEQVPAADESAFRAALDAALEVLPLPPSKTGAALKGEIESASNDFEALFELGKLLYGAKFEEPRQLKLWQSPSE